MFGKVDDNGFEWVTAGGIPQMPHTNTTPTWGWFWNLPDRMKYGGLITLPGGNSSYTIGKIWLVSKRVEMSVCRVDLPHTPENIRNISLANDEWFMYAMSDYESREYFPKE